MLVLGLLCLFLGGSRGESGVLKEAADCLGREGAVDCLRARSLELFKGWMAEQKEEDDRGQELPSGVEDLAESLTTGVMRFFGFGDEEEPKEQDRSSPNDVQQDQARGPKKKIRKAVRRAIIKLIIIAFVIKHKIKMLIVAFQTLLGFKFLLLASLYVVTAVVKLWAEIKNKHHAQKVFYYENAHHQHHYDHDHHHDHYDEGGWGHGLWGRSIATAASLVAEPTAPAYAALPSRSEYSPSVGHSLSAQEASYAAQSAAYSAQIPSSYKD